MWQRYEFFSKKAYLCSMNNEKKYLLGLTLAELKQVAKDLGMPAFTGGQMAKWLYEQHVKSIDEMTNISKANRAKLAAEYPLRFITGGLQDELSLLPDRKARIRG